MYGVHRNEVGYRAGLPVIVAVEGKYHNGVTELPRVYDKVPTKKIRVRLADGRSVKVQTRDIVMPEV